MHTPCKSLTYNRIYSQFKSTDAPLSQIYLVNEQFEAKLLLHGESIWKKVLPSNQEIYYIMQESYLIVHPYYTDGIANGK